MNKQGRPRKHQYDIPAGLPLRTYKMVLNREKRLKKREDYLMTLIEQADHVIKCLLKRQDLLKNTPEDVAKVLNKHKELLHYHRAKRKVADFIHKPIVDNSPNFVDNFVSQSIDNRI